MGKVIYCLLESTWMRCEAQSSVKKQATLTSSEPQGTAPSADYLGHSLHENGSVFGEVADVNYIFPGFLPPLL